MIFVWAFCTAITISAIIMFAKALDDAETWWTAILLMLGLLISSMGFVLGLGYVLAEILK